MNRQHMVELAELISTSVVNALKDSGLVGKPVKSRENKKEMNAYQKTEALLFSYVNFNKIVEEKKQEIADLRKYGVPQKSAMSGGERVQTSRTVQGIVLPEDAVEDAVRTVQASVQGTVQAIAMIDKGMESLQYDPYYKILEMRYFEGRTQEDIAEELNCTQKTISINKNRLVKELAMRLFPDQAIKEMMH